MDQENGYIRAWLSLPTYVIAPAEPSAVSSGTTLHPWRDYFCLDRLGSQSASQPNRPNPEKLSTYESGRPYRRCSHSNSNRFYLVGLIFLIFDVEVLFIPLATVFADRDIIQAIPEWGTFVLAEMLLFAGILILGLIYVWVKGT